METYRIIGVVNGTVITAVVDGDRHAITAQAPSYARQATSAANRQVTGVPLIAGMPYKTFTAGWESPVAVAAALFSIDPGHTELVEAPAEVWALLGRQSPSAGAVSVRNAGPIGITP